MKKITVPAFPLGGEALLSEDEATRELRRAFYAALDAEAKGVKDALVDRCRHAMDQIDRVQLSLGPEELGAEILAPVRPCVERWANIYKLNVDWLVEDALEWLLDPVGPIAPSHQPAWRNLSPVARVCVPFEYYWHYPAQPRAVIKDFAVARFTELLDAELDRIEGQAAALGVRRHEGKKMKQGRDSDRHFRWLVRRQVLGDAYPVIAKSENPPVDRKTVRDAVMETAAMIGLQLRESDPVGAKPGSRGSRG
jgi:hypothetical protein